MSSLFEVHGEAFLPTDYSRGPWDENHLHGGAPAALMTGAMEEMGGPDQAMSRIAGELMRPQPMDRLTVTASPVRRGRKVSIVEASLTVTATNVTVATARATAVARHDTESVDRTPALRGPATAAPQAYADATESLVRAFHTEANEIRWE